MNIYCDRFSVCNSMFRDRGEDTEAAARAKGWHIWRGKTMSGKDSEVVLCNKCVASYRRDLPSTAQPLGEQYPIPELRLVKPQDV